jgi:hypothetical protein
MILGVLDPSGAAATWRAYYSNNRKNIITTSSASAEFRTTGEPISMNNKFNYKKDVSAGTRGTAFDQQDDDNYWQSKQMQPLILRPLGSGIRNAMLINEGESHTNPIAGTNDFSGGLVSRASGMNPMNYTLIDSNDISDRLRANTVSANDPLSAQYALRLAPGNQMDPKNIEGNPLLNTFQTEESAQRQAKTQLVNGELFAYQDIDNANRDPTFEAGLRARSYLNKLKQHLPKDPMESIRRHTLDMARAVTSLKMVGNNLQLADGVLPEDDESTEDDPLNNNGGPPGGGGGGPPDGGDGGGNGGASGGGGGGSVPNVSSSSLGRSGNFVQGIPTQSSGFTTRFEQGTGMMTSAPLARIKGKQAQASTILDSGDSATDNVGSLVNNQPGLKPFMAMVYNRTEKSRNQPDAFGSGGAAKLNMEVQTAMLLNQMATINQAAKKLPSAGGMKASAEISSATPLASGTGLKREKKSNRLDVGSSVLQTEEEKQQIALATEEKLIGVKVANLWTQQAEIMETSWRDDDDAYSGALAVMIRNQADTKGYLTLKEQRDSLKELFQTFNRDKFAAAEAAKQLQIDYMSSQGTYEKSIHDIADQFMSFVSQQQNYSLNPPTSAPSDFNDILRHSSSASGGGRSSTGGDDMQEGPRIVYKSIVPTYRNESSNIGKKSGGKEKAQNILPPKGKREGGKENAQSSKERKAIQKGSYAVQPTELYSEEIQSFKKRTEVMEAMLIQLLSKPRDPPHIHQTYVTNNYDNSVTNNNHDNGVYNNFLDESRTEINNNNSYVDARSQQHNATNNQYALYSPRVDPYGQQIMDISSASGGGGPPGDGSSVAIQGHDRRINSSVNDRKAIRDSTFLEKRGIVSGGAPNSQALLQIGNISDFTSPYSNKSVSDNLSENDNQSAFAMSSAAVVDSIVNETDRLLSFLNEEGVVPLDFFGDVDFDRYEGNTAIRRRNYLNRIRGQGEVYKEKSPFAVSLIRAVPTMEGLLRQNNEQALMEIFASLVHACYDTKEGNEDAEKSQRLFYKGLEQVGPIASAAGVTSEELVYMMTDLMAFCAEHPKPGGVRRLQKLKLEEKPDKIDVRFDDVV